MLFRSEDCEAQWTVPYEPGELRCVSEEVECALRTPVDASELRLEPDRTDIKADGEDVLQVEVSLFGTRGNPVASRDLMVSYAVTDGASIIGVENGDPQDLTPYTSHDRKTYRGQSIVYIRAGDTPGEATLTARAENGICAEVIVSVR